MLGTISIIKGAQSLTGNGGVEIDLILLASSLVIMMVYLEESHLHTSLKNYLDVFID